MSDYNEDIQELIKITKNLHKEVRRLNNKIRNERLTRILNSIPSKTVLYSGNQLNKINPYCKKIDNDKIIINFNE